uniref:Gag-Pol polyprotein n=1 Tax=Tanacetum cinerariifolium TaxID=118510 RepID=A0A699HH84_TANCI|nr:Gag-Pol polyprotein [Tanacetum cinerariifolium]
MLQVIPTASDEDSTVSEKSFPLLIPAVPATDDSLAVPEHTTVETPMNMYPKNKAHYESEKEAIHLILTGIGDEIYSTVDACKIAREMFVMNVKQQHKLDKVSYHKLFDILKQYQKDVNELRAKIIAKNANPLALVATAQSNQELYYQTPKPHKPYAPTSKASISTRSHATTRNKENLALIAKYFKKIYKPTNNNLRTSLNSRNKNVDTTLRYKNDNQSGQFRSQRMVNVARARENVGNLAVQQSEIQCFNYMEFGHFAKECRKPKRVKDSAYHKEKMLICKQAEKGVLLQAEQFDLLVDTDEEIDEQELEAHYSYMAKIQEVPTANSGTDSEPLEQVQYNDENNVFANVNQHCEQSKSTSNKCLVENDDSDVTPESPDMCEHDIQTYQNAEDERAVLVNLIANLKFNVDENKKIQKKLKKANTSIAHDLEQCKSILAKTSKTSKESNSVRDSCLAQSEKPCLYEIPNDQSDPTNELVPDREETLTLAEESRSKLNKDYVRPYDYTKLNSLKDTLIVSQSVTVSQRETVSQSQQSNDSYAKLVPTIREKRDYSVQQSPYSKAEDPILEFSTSGIRAWIQCCSSSYCSNLLFSQEGLSWTGLPEFADDTVTDYSRPSPTVESIPGDAQNRNSSASENGKSTDSIFSKPAVKFVKAAERSTTNKVETVKKPSVRYAELYRKPSKKSTVRGNQRNWNNLKSQQLGENFVRKNRACFNCGHFDHLSYNCGLGVKIRRSSPKNNYTHRSMPPRPAIHRPYRPPMRTTRPNSNAATRPYVNSTRP